MINKIIKKIGSKKSASHDLLNRITIEKSFSHLLGEFQMIHKINQILLTNLSSQVE